MDALFLSSDRGILNPESSVRARMQRYAKAIGTLHIVLRASRTETVSQGELHIHAVAAHPLTAPFSLARAAHTLIKHEGIEIVSTQDPFELGLAGVWAVQGTNAVLHVQLHTDPWSPWFVRNSFRNRVRRYIAGCVLPKAKGIRVVSARVARAISKRYGSRVASPSVLPIAVDPETQAKVAVPRPFPCMMLCVSRLEPEKRLEDVLHALRLASQAHPTLGLVIVGEGSEGQALERLATTLGIRERVVFLGARSDARQLMHDADIFVQASAYEGYGRTLVEAALARLPLITSNVGIVGDVFVSGEDALVCEPGDVEVLAQAMEQLCEDENLRTRLSEHAFVKASAEALSEEVLATRVAEDLRATLPKG